MASGSKNEQAGAPALDDVKTERETEAASRAQEGGSKGGATESTPARSGDSPKPHGDKMEHAVKEAANTPPKGNG